MAIRSNNPYLNNINRQINKNNEEVIENNSASYKGIILKVVLLLGITIISGLVSCILFYIPYVPYILLGVGGFGCFIIAIIGYSNIKLAPSMSILYAIFQGLMLGFVTYILEYYYPGIGLASVLGVLLVFIITLILYCIKALRVNKVFIKVISIASITSLISMVLILIISSLSSYFTYSSSLGDKFFYLVIGLTLVMIIYGSLCLVLDFDRIHNMVEMNMDKKYEWYASFGLIISIIWLYLQVLRLFLLLGSRKK